MKATERLAFPPVPVGLRGLRAADLPREAGAGVTLAALAVPLNIGYAQIAGLPPVAGLYAAIVPMLVFALACSSRQLVASPDAPISALIASLLTAIVADPGSDAYVELAYAQALVCAAVFGLFAVLRLGFVAAFLSEPVLLGFIAGLAVEILTSQVKKILAISTTAEDYFPELWQIVTAVPDANGWSVLVGAGTITAVWALRSVLPALPGPLVVLIVATVAVTATGLDERGVKVLGEVPSGLPAPHWPSVSLGQWAALLPGAIAICAVTLADGLLTARRYAEQHGYHVDADRELGAFGLSNVFAGLTQSMTVGASASRTAAMDATGSRTQLPSLVCALVVAVVLAFFAGLLRYLPEAALAGIVAFAVARLIDVRHLARLRRMRRSEFVVAMVCLLGVPVLGSLTAVIIAFVFSAVDFVGRASRPVTATLHPGPEGRFVRSRTPGQMAAPGLYLYRFGGPLFFASAATFAADLRRLAAERPRWIVWDTETVSDIDATGAETLQDVLATLHDRDITFATARATAHLRDLLAHYGLGELTHYDSNQAALAAFQEAHPSTRDDAQ